MTIIKADYLHRLRSFVSKEKTRYYLGGVCIQSAPSGGAFLIATDGHILGVFHDDSAIVSPEHEGAIIQLSTEFVRALKATRKDSGPRFVHLQAQTATIRITHDRVSEIGSEEDALVLSSPSQTFAQILIDGTYPDWRRAVPLEPSHPEGFPSYNANYLGAFKECSNSKSAPIRLYSQDEETAAIVKTDRADFLGVLMPVRAANAGVDGEILPAWLETPKAKAA